MDTPKPPKKPGPAFGTAEMRRRAMVAALKQRKPKREMPDEVAEEYEAGNEGRYAK